MVMRYGAVGAIALAATCALLLAFPRLPHGFVFPDAYYYAEMGRQLYRGEGFSSLQAYPYLLVWLKENGLPLAPPWPNVSRFPLLTMLNAIGFAIAGPTDTTVKAVGGLLFVLTAIATSLLGARLFGIGVGLLAALLYLTNGTQIFFALSGLLETGAGLFIVASTLALAVTIEAGGRSRLPAFVLGALLGLAFLLRYDLLVLTPAAAGVLWVGRRDGRRRDLAWMTAGFVVVVGPWIARNLVAFGSPLALLAIDRNLFGARGRSDAYDSFSRVELWERVWNEADFVLQKLRNRFTYPLIRWRTLFGPSFVWLGPAFVASSVVLVATRHRAVRAWAFVVVGFVLRTLLLSMMHHEIRFYQSFTAVVLVLTLGGAAVALGMLLGPRRAVGWALGSIVLVAALFSYLRFLSSPSLPGSGASPSSTSPLARMLTDVRRGTPPGTVIATRWPAVVAWYADRPALDLSLEGVRRARRMGVPIDGLLYRDESAAGVERFLPAHRLASEFVNVPTPDLPATLWLRPDLARAYLAQQDSARASPSP